MALSRKIAQSEIKKAKKGDKKCLDSEIDIEAEIELLLKRKDIIFISPEDLPSEDKDIYLGSGLFYEKASDGIFKLVDMDEVGGWFGVILRRGFYMWCHPREAEIARHLIRRTYRHSSDLTKVRVKKYPCYGYKEKESK